MNALRISETEVELVRVLFLDDGEEMQRIFLDRLLHVEGREVDLHNAIYLPAFGITHIFRAIV